MPWAARSTMTLPESSPPLITRPPIPNFSSPFLIRSYLFSSSIFLTFTLELPASEPAFSASIRSSLSGVSTVTLFTSTRLYRPAYPLGIITVSISHLCRPFNYCIKTTAVSTACNHAYSFHINIPPS
jgi:hypothetical protein